jgi:signal transduction histidine kinase/DNA-binding NarL/FixJ family response regulator
MMKPTGPHRHVDGHPPREGARAARPVRSVQGEVLRREVRAPDASIPELQRAKAAAEAANEAKSRYLVAVSHEIRSPLNAIYGYAQLLERGDAVTGAEAGAVIRRSVDHLTNLAESLLEISRIESGVLKIRADVIDIRALLGQVTSMFRAQALAKGLYIRLNMCSNLPTMVKTDEKRLRQILINLVSNAIKYTETGGVEIAVQYRSQVATIEVIDTGIGIDPNETERIFEPFERGSSQRAQSQPGIGLGLTITRVLARVMGGEVSATSTPGVGSCFRLKMMLPQPLAAAVDEAPVMRIEGYQGPRRTVLIIEDDLAQCAAMQSFLRSLDFIVFCAGTGLEGIELATRCVPDLVLLDVQMPGINGWETARRLREAQGPALKIIMASASATDPGVIDRGGTVHDAFIVKPVEFDALLATMQEQLALRWNNATFAQASEQDRADSSLPIDARPYLRRLRHYAQIGHVLAIEKQLAELEQAHPEVSAFVLMLREYANNFDFDSVIKKIEDAGER